MTWVAILFTFIAMMSSRAAKRHAQKALALVEASDRDRLEMQRSLFTIVDMDGNSKVKALFAGPEVPDAKTPPCGMMCNRAFWAADRKDWHCQVDQGLPCDEVRPKLEDATGNCPHYRPSKFALETESTL